MKAPINTLTDLRTEIQRLSLQKKEQEIQLSVKLANLTEQLKPVNMLKSFIGSVKKDAEVKNQFASIGTEAAIGFILSNVLFRKSNPIIKTIVTLAGTSFFSKLIGDDVLKYIEKLKVIINKFRSDNHEPADDSFNEKDIYRDE